MNTPNAKSKSGVSTQLQSTSPQGIKLCSPFKGNPYGTCCYENCKTARTVNSVCSNCSHFVCTNKNWSTHRSATKVIGDHYICRHCDFL